MKKLLLCAFVALPVLAPKSNAAPTRKVVIAKSNSKTKVNWRASFPAALAEAKRTGRPIFVDFFTTWCGPCKYLDAVTYKDPRFVAESKNWIMVKVDAEKNKANVQLAQKYKVEGYPSMVFLKPGGKESSRVVGGYPPEMLVPEMKKAAIKAAGATRI
ncbi:Thioredoxin-like [Abditibacterium utsteinense]|uniref:Thioredoxin-like n=1 Tax=Abditibacterium utsteinense TaxID=1960156 RepID=A0A2S8SR07_9BACT|nr:thioredoxin family protein [Abditibacterium utsteinense]PQV63233.1 Thioredoxin-like [Abditibacterium utsteinense]